MDDSLHSNLQEVDTLEATVIIDNELDPMSPAAPDTVRIAGQMGNLIFKPGNEITDRGDATRELRMGDICCAAHGLSILVVRHHIISNFSDPFKCDHNTTCGLYWLIDWYLVTDSNSGWQGTLCPFWCRSWGRYLGTQCETITSGSCFSGGYPIVALAPGPLRWVWSFLPSWAWYRINDLRQVAFCEPFVWSKMQKRLKAVQMILLLTCIPIDPLIGAWLLLKL